MANSCYFKPECLHGTPDGPGAVYFDLLPDGVITDIFSRLPIQQLLQCNQVCRRWNSLLGTPDFAEEHEKKNTSQVPLAFVRRENQEDRRELVFVRDREAIIRKENLFRRVRLNRELREKVSWPRSVLRGTYNGLLLFEGDPFDSTYCIFNPLTREAVTFKNSDRVCGLYFHPPKGQYRLLCYREISGTNSFLYYVCSTGQELLKEVGTFDFKPDVFETIEIDIPGVAAKGFLYWLAYREYDSGRYIMRFDVVNEILELRAYPKGPSGYDPVKLYEHWSSRLFELGDQLYVYLTTEVGLEVWVLEDSTSWRWAKVFAPCIDRGNKWGQFFYRVPLTIEDGQLVFLLPWGIFRTSSDPIGMSLVGDRRKKKHLFCYCSMVNWRRSLVSFRDYL